MYPTNRPWRPLPNLIIARHTTVRSLSPALCPIVGSYGTQLVDEKSLAVGATAAQPVGWFWFVREKERERARFAVDGAVLSGHRV